MKIGLITDNYPTLPGGPVTVPGGIGMYTKVVGEQLASLGHDVHVFTSADVPKHTKVVHRGVKVWQCPLWSKRREMGPWRAAEFTLRYKADALLLNAYTIKVAIRQASGDGLFDVLEAPNAGALGSLSRGFTRCYAVRLHAGTAFFATKPGGKVEFTRMDELVREDTLGADVLTAPTAYSRRAVESFLDTALGDVHVVGNPVTVEANAVDRSDYSIENSRPTALLFGRLIHQKGIDTLAEATRLVRKVYPKFKATFVGPDLMWHDGRKASEVILDLVGEADAVAVIPSMDHVQLRSIAMKHTIAVFPSREETFGMTLLEAMAWGLPCIAADIAPFREIGQVGVSCVFARPDDVTELADKIISLLGDEELRKRIGVGGSARAGHWGTERIVEQLLEAWRSTKRCAEKEGFNKEISSLAGGPC